MRKKTAGILILSALYSVVSGCAGVMIDKEAVKNVKKAGILSLTLKKTGPNAPGNEKILRQTAYYTLARAESGLKKSAPFKIVPVASLYKIPEYANAGTMAKASGALKYFRNNPKAMVQNKTASTGEDFAKALREGLAALDNASKGRNNIAAAAQNVIDEYKKDFIGVKGLPFIPYGLINNEKPGQAVTYVNGVKQGGENEGLKQAMLEQIKAVCAAAGLDAVIIIHAEAAADQPKGMRMVMGNRVAGTLRFDTSMIMIDKNGRIIADFGWPVLDDLAPMALARPVHKAVTWRKAKNGKKWPKKIKIDLADKKGVILKDLKKLSDEAVKRMARKLQNEMNKQ